MRLEAQKAIDERKLMEAHAVDMASKAKASRQVADTVREESARELERMEALVAAVQEQDRLANSQVARPGHGRDRRRARGSVQAAEGGCCIGEGVRQRRGRRVSRGREPGSESDGAGRGGGR